MSKNQRFQLKRHPANPILKPDPLSPWESYNVLNPSVIYHNGLFHMHYRAQGVDWVSRIGYALSHDGVRWNRLRQPVLTPKCEFETKGVEDPRVTEIDGVFYMTYCGNAPYREGIEYYGNIYPMIAKSANLVDWERIGPMVRGEDNKDHVLFPKKFNGRYCALHRRRPAIWIAYSDDLRTWPQAEMKEIASPRPNCAWEGKSSV